ncbi:MAG TPA: hypothetical protein VGP70_13245 [Actinomadura sp.]|nr:hypothetical protein [Actinomadura sp.]
MRMLSRTSRLTLIALSVTAAGGGVLSASGAHAASAPGHAGVPSIEGGLVLDSGPGAEGDIEGHVHGRVESRINGRNNATNQNSPTNNLGNQNNSSANSGGQHSFQSGQCGGSEICEIDQENVFGHGLHGFGGHPPAWRRSAALSRFHQSLSSSVSASANSSPSGIVLSTVAPSGDSGPGGGAIP